MQWNQESHTETGQAGRLPMLAMLWDELAGNGGRALFEEEFRPELERLSRFLNDFPGAPSGTLNSLLEQKVIDSIRDGFSRERILALRARLNRSN